MRDRKTYASELTVIKTLAQTLKTNERFHGSLTAQVDVIIQKLGEIEHDITNYDSEKEQIKRERENWNKEKNDWENHKNEERSKWLSERELEVRGGDPNSVYDENGVVRNKTHGPVETPVPTEAPKENLGSILIPVNDDNKKELDKLANRELPAIDTLEVSSTRELLDKYKDKP